MKDGWKCPECGQVYAPWVDKCEYCKNKYLTTWPPKVTYTQPCYICGGHHEVGMMCPDSKITST